MNPENNNSADFDHKYKPVKISHLPGYSEWSQKKLDSGVLPDTIAYLDSLQTWLRPEDISKVTEEDFEEYLEEVEDQLEQ